MDMTERSVSADPEIVATGDGSRVRLFPPILGTVCSRCAERTDDVSFVIEAGDGDQAAGGLCGPCLIALLRGVTEGGY
ncbi:MAG: hypothetical protein U0R71_01280 [Solirubrobacterales bacterium]